MKRFYFIAITFIFYQLSLAAPVIKAVSNGYWRLASTWDLNRLPKAGDTVVIGANRTITIDDDQDLGGATAVTIYGKLKFENNNSTLKLSNLGAIWVFTNATIEGGGSASQKIKIGNSQVFKGNDAAIIGPQMANAATSGFDPFVDTQFLPVKFIAFTATKNSSTIFLQWSTADEINANMYELERSVDGLNWNTIAYLAATGTTKNLSNYSYSDKSITDKIVYYRVKEVDIDGNFTYTVIRSVKTEVMVASTIKIASIEKRVLLQFPEEINGDVVVRFISLNGQVLEQQTIKHPFGQVLLTSKTQGNQIVSVTNGSSVNLAKQVIL